MKKYLQKKLNNEKGMTLIELLAVIVIIAIIAAIAIPAIGNILENSRNGAVKADFQQAIAAANLYVTEEGNLPTGTGAEQLTALAPYLDDPGSLTSVTITRNASNSLTIAGAADEDGNGTAEYTITTALTNAQLSNIPNERFTGTAIPVAGNNPS